MTLEEVAESLVAALDAHLEPWLVRVGAARLPAGAGAAAVEDLARAASRSAVLAVTELRHLVGLDVDEQRTTPLSVVRSAVAEVTAVLAAHGAVAPERDAWSVERFPDDVYDLAPATLADIDPSVGDAAVAWGAAKAWEHRRRHAG